MSEDDDAAAAFYDVPENRRLTGPGRRRPTQAARLTSHVPIRFSAAVIERVKELAADDGKTVSSWIRDVIDREVLLRERSKTVGVTPHLVWERKPAPASSTVASSAEDLGDLRELVS